MICKHCGTEIADKALVCYRCGQATFEPQVKPGKAPARRSSVPLVAAMLVLVIGALYMGQATSGQLPKVVSWVVAVLAVVVVAWALIKRRR